MIKILNSQLLNDLSNEMILGSKTLMMLKQQGDIVWLNTLLENFQIKLSSYKCVIHEK